MPYINQTRRDALFNCSNTDCNSEMMTSGELNYMITILITEYLAFNKLSYATINDVIGALECSKLEFVRRIVEPYEKKKCKLNGDVYK